MIASEFSELPEFLAASLVEAGIQPFLSPAKISPSTVLISVRSVSSPRGEGKRLALENAKTDIPQILLAEILRKCKAPSATFSAAMEVPDGIDDGAVIENEKGIPVRVLCYYDIMADRYAYQASVFIHA